MTAHQTRRFLIGLARAFGGALIFAIPLLMTMEMWWLGFHMDRLRLVLLLLVNFPLLVGLSHYSGFEPTFDWKDDALDACVAYGVGLVMSAIILTALGIIKPDMSSHEIIGMVALQAIPGSIGALMAEGELGAEEEDEEKQERKENTSYGGELFLMIAGALFLALNLAPTEEMILIAYKMTEWHALTMMGLSLAVMHALVYMVQFEGQATLLPDSTQIGVFIRYTVVGYMLVLLVSAFVLWVFGRADATALDQVVMMSVVLAFPGAVGAAIARLVI